MKRLVVAALLASFAGLIGMATGTAAAGTNGQQIIYHHGIGATGHECTTGMNQRDIKVTRCHDLNRNGEYTYVPGVWWKGRVSYTLYGPDGSFTDWCDVPVSYGQDYYTCEGHAI